MWLPICEVRISLRWTGLGCAVSNRRSMHVLRACFHLSSNSLKDVHPLPGVRTVRCADIVGCVQPDALQLRAMTPLPVAGYG